MLKCSSIFLGLCGGVLACAAVLGATAPPEDKLASFGFTGPEVFPIDSSISLLHAADLDGDGLTDLIVVNNARSKIELLYNQTGKTNLAAARPGRKLEMNELPPDARFRIESIPSEKRIYSLVVADLNGDGRPDLAYYGDPKELVVLYNLGSNNWSAPKRWPIDDGQLTPNAALATGDLNGTNGRVWFCWARTTFISCPNWPTIRWASRAKYPSPARSKWCRFWILMATDAMTCC